MRNEQWNALRELSIWSDRKSLNGLSGLFLRTYLHQIQGKFRNFLVCKFEDTTHERMQRWMWNLQLPEDINSLIESFGVRWTWLDYYTLAQANFFLLIYKFRYVFKPHVWNDGSPMVDQVGAGDLSNRGTTFLNKVFYRKSSIKPPPPPPPHLK